MGQRGRLVLGIAILAIVALVVWSIPWKYVIEHIGQLLIIDDRPAWVRADGQVYNIALFPELFQVIGSEYGGDGKSTFAMPKIEEYDYLANDRFGTITLYRCVATRKLEDNSPAATLGWCGR